MNDNENILIGSVGQTFIGTSFNSLNSSAIGFWNIYQQGKITSVENDEIIPDKFELRQNYPNPFNPSTSISFSIPNEELVSLKVYNSLGEEVAELINETKQAGNYEMNFNSVGLASGIYFYRIQAGSFIQTKKMTLLK
ncbi:T9SS type A sorting domain-containing protein [Ignavibacterium sp.]|uniref:T9SS type A sorting domain-containing protein n=1 Tax=Ignavibacterium sp. TaxID=2651167 RepID=UPI00307D7FB6